MPKFSGRPVQLAQDGFTSSATSQHALGQLAMTDDGRWFRYCQAGAADLVAGNCIQSSAVIVDHLALTAAVALVGAQTTVVTPGATAGAANLYADGYLGVDTTPDLGRTYGIAGHPAITASTAFTLTLDPEDGGVQTAWSTATRYGLLANPYKNVIQMPATTATGLLVGVAQYIILATQFGWIQTKGIASVLISGTPALGAGVMSPSATAGAAIIVTTTNLIVAQYVGRMAQIGVSGKANFVMLNID